MYIHLHYFMIQNIFSSMCTNPQLINEIEMTQQGRVCCAYRPLRANSQRSDGMGLYPTPPFFKRPLNDQSVANWCWISKR